MAPRNSRVNPETQVRSPARSFLNSLDNFYAPARDTRKEQALQQGISSFSGILGEKATAMRTERRQGEFSQGTADALREQAGAEMRGVQTGSIFRQNSRYYMMGLNETRGKAAGARFKSDLTLAYQEWDGRNTDDDGAAFREWMNGEVSGFLGTLGDNQYMLSGAMPVINEVAANFAAQHTAFTATRLQTESFAAYDEIVSGVFSDLADGDLSMEDAVAAIASEADDMYNADGASANDRVVEAAIRYANIHNDPDSIMVLALAHDNGSLLLSQSNREKLSNAMDAVEADIQRNTSRDNAQATAEDKAQREATLTAWGTALQDNPYAELPTFSEVGDQTTYRNMVTLQDAFIKSSSVDNPAVTSIQRMQLESDLFGAGSTAAKIAILAEFTQSNPTALSGTDVTRYSQSIFATADPGSLVNDQLVSKYRTGFGKTLGTFERGSGYLDTQVSFFRTQGEMHFNDYMMSKAGSVDMNDPSSIRSAIQEAEDYAMEQLAFDFPTQMRDLQKTSPVSGVLGSSQALESRDTAVADAAASIYQDMANGSSDAPQTTQPDPMSPDVTPPAVADVVDVPLAEQEVPFNDPNLGEDVAYSPTREGFYGEIIQRFTDGKDTRRTGAVAAIENDPEFKSGVQRLADKYDVPMTAFLAIMQFETGGSFAPDQLNAAGSGAIGLIQFLPSTAVSLGTTPDALAQMTNVEQLVYVEKYFDQFASSIRGGQVDDLYMAVLFPRAIGKEDGYALFTEGSTAYRQNAGLDTNRDGVVTKYEAASKVKSIFNGY